ncbi:MAG TPA: hypothetical protein VF668_11085 [Pyrinomonadaceae bacterium]
MNIWREVGRKYVVWLLMLSGTAACAVFAARPLEDAWGAEHLGLLLQLLLAGSLLALNLFYFSARVKDEKLTKAVALCIPAAMFLFPDYVWGTLGGVFGALDPAASALLAMAAGLAALNLGVHLFDALAPRGRGPS